MIQIACFLFVVLVDFSSAVWYDNCEEASKIGDSIYCTSCPNGYYLWNVRLCLQECPSGFVVNNGVCELSQSTILDISFNDTQTSYSTENFTVSLDSSGTESPIPTYGRGLFFNKTTATISAKNGNLILDSTFLIEFWIRPEEIDGEQTLFFKGSPEVQTQNPNDDEFLLDADENMEGSISVIIDSSTVTFAINLVSNSTEGYTELSSGIDLSGWNLVGVSASFDEVQNRTTLAIWNNGRKLVSQSYPNEFFVDPAMSTTTITQLGPKVGNDTEDLGYYFGFIAAVRIQNGNFQESNDDNCLLSSEICKIDCDFGQTLENGQCVACGSDCLDCVRSSDCRLNEDPLCVQSSSFFSCDSCVSLAQLNSQGKCECVPNGSTDSTGLSCECNSGYKASSGECVSCLNYFEPSQVSAYFSEKYTKIYVIVDQEAVTNSGSCDTFFEPETLDKLGKGPLCSWQNSTALVVTLGSNFTLRQERIKLKAENILRKEGECSFDYLKLEPLAEYKYPLPTPSAKLSAPYSYSIPCATKPLAISADATGKAGGFLSFKWSQVDGPTTLDLSSETGNSLSINKNQLSQGEYKFSVAVSNIFERSDSAEIAVKVNETQTLSVEIDAGNEISLRSGDSIKIKTVVGDFCGGSTSVQYSWEYVGTSNREEAPGNPGGVVSNSRQSHVLSIKEGNLQAGYTYVFKATAQEGQSYGEAFLNVVVETSPLVAVLNKVDGQISSGKDLQLDASDSSDPDKSEGSLEFEWTCTEPGKNFCEDGSGGQLLETQPTGSILQIESEKLRAGAFYSFCVKVSKDTRETQKCVELEVVDMGDGGMDLPEPLFKMNHQWGLIIWLYVQGSLENTIQWNQVLGPSLTPTTPLQSPYIYFPAYSMTPGSYYGWQVRLFNPAGASLAMTIPWNTNVGPSCLGGLEMNPTTGSALFTNFELSIVDCFDGDEEDYPLFYSFGLIWNGFYIPLAPPRLSSRVTTKLLPGTNTLFAMVCDKLWSCEYYTQSFTIGSVSKRRLEEKSVSESFLEDVKDPELIPGTVLMYCESLDLEEEAIQTMLSKLKEFNAELEDIDKSTYSNVVGAISAMMNEGNTTESHALELVDLAMPMLDFELEILEEDVKLLMQSTKGLISKFSLSNEVLQKSQSLISKAFNKYFKNSAPGDKPKDVSAENVSTYRMTEVPKNLKNTTIEALDLVMPESLPFGDTDVVDLELTTYKQEGNYSDIVDLSFFKGGSYSGFDLQLEDRSLYSLEDLSEPIGIKVLLRNESEVENWTCKYLKDGNWVEEGCEIAELRNDSAVIEVTHTSIFRLESAPAKAVVTPDSDPVVQESEDCSHNYAPLYLMTAVSGAGVVLVILSLTVGRKLEHASAEKVQAAPSNEKGPNVSQEAFETEKYTTRNETRSPETTKKHQFLLNHLVLGILRVPNQLRIIRVVCIVSELLILGCLMGAFTAAFQETDSEDRQEEDFGGAEIGIMFLAMALTSIILGAVEATMKVCNSMKARLGVLIGMLVLACLSFGMTGYMCSEFCEVWSLLWTYSYLLGIALEILLSQSLRALVTTFSTKSLKVT